MIPCLTFVRLQTGDAVVHKVYVDHEFFFFFFPFGLFDIDNQMQHLLLMHIKMHMFVGGMFSVDMPLGWI